MEIDHAALTRAVIEQAKRKSVEREVRTEAIPADVAQRIAALEKAVETLRQRLATEQGRIDSILKAVEDANG